MNYERYDYKEVKIDHSPDYKYLDDLSCFGWKEDENKSNEKVYVFKRPQSIINKNELIRLERNYQSCLKEIKKLKDTVHAKSIAIALCVGLIGSLFIILSLLEITKDVPNLMIFIPLSLIGLLLWTLPVYVYKFAMTNGEEKIIKFINQKQDEIDIICDKALKLLHK